jgi:inorganic pyrophosphatase
VQENKLLKSKRPAEFSRTASDSGHLIAEWRKVCRKGTNLNDGERINSYLFDGGQMSKKNGLADPTRLKPFDSDDKQMLRVVIETPKGSRNKFAFDPDEQIFELKKVLPAGMAFPYDFGFVPSTKADDGDPVDVLVLMDEPAFAGCVLSCRVIGVIEGEQGDKKDKERNDRIVAVEKDARSWADIKTIDDLGEEFCRELEEFFVNYHKLSGQKYRVLGVRGPAEARKLVKSGMR